MARIIDIVMAVAPQCAPPYRQAFTQFGDDLFAQFSLSTEDRVAHFLARCISETGAFTVLVEDANYTRANLATQWKRGNGHNQFGSQAEMMSYAGRPADLFNRWYGGRMGNGGPATGDGYRYRGRGPLQTTGKAAYRKYGKRMGVNLVADPDLILDPRYILLPSLYEWQDGGLNAYADKDDALSIARIINVGTARTTQIPNGYKDQLAALRRVRAAIKRLGGLDLPAASGEPAPTSPAPEPPPAADAIDPDDGLSKEEVKEIQKLLRSKKYFGVGRVDGKWGQNTAGALRKFQEAAGLPVTVSKDRAWVDAATVAALVTGPDATVSESRAATTAATMRQHGDVVAKSTWWAKIWAWAVGAPSLAVGVAGQTDTASGYIATAKSLLADVPDVVWLGALVAVAAAIYLTAQRAEGAAVANVRDGRDAGPA